jgi:metal-responsive CopG/Arc/MetJ family transcriptional regulator
MQYIAAHISVEMMAKVSEVAADLRVSRSALVRLALESYLENPHRLVQVAPRLEPVSLRMTITD